MFSLRGFLAYRVSQPVIRLIDKMWPGTKDALKYMRKERTKFRNLRLDPSRNIRVFQDYLESKFPGLVLGPGDVVLDIGANEGWVSFLLGGSGARVIGFEPNPQAFHVATERCAGFPNVTLVNLAVSEETGMVDLFFPPNYRHAPSYFSEWVSTARTNEAVSPSHSLGVLGIALADILRPFDEVTFLKIDIEGGEMDLWRTLEEEWGKVRFLAMEVHPGLLPGQDQFIQRAEKFIKDKQLESRWRLDWP